MEQQPVIPPSAEELRAYSLGKCEPERAAQIEAYLLGGPDCGSILAAAPEDAVVGHLRGAGELPPIQGELPLALGRHVVRASHTVTTPPHAASINGATLTFSGGPGVGSVSPPGYEILGELGRGGMGIVYKARQLALDRVVALKMILAGGHAGAAERTRFRTEAEAVARLQHANIVQIHDVGEYQGLPYFSLEFCPGGSLEKQLNGTPLPPREATALVETLALAVQAAHAQRIIHRDLNPANVLQAADGTLKISDFGLAKKLDQTGQTQSGAIMGTPSYMAPEQAAGKGQVIGPAADVYALGAILYECLTGRPPFKAATPLDTALQVVTEEPVPVRQVQPRTPRDLETICLKCLQKEPHKRYATALALAEDLRRFQAGEPITARPVGRVERGWRWCRRNPAVALLSTAAVLMLMAVAIVSVVFAVAQGEAARSLQAEKDRAEAALLSSRSNQALLTADRAIRICEEGEDGQAPDPYRGLLWLTRAVELAPADDETLQYLLRANWAAWEAHVCPFQGTLSLQPGTNKRFVVWSPDGRQVLGGGKKGLEIWDVRSGRQVRALPFEEKTVCVAWSPDGRRVASGGLYDVPIRIWNLDDNTVRMRDAPARVNDLNFSPDSKQLAAACDNGEVSFLDATTAEPLAPPLGLNDGVLSVAFHPRNNRLLTTTSSTLQQWDALNHAAVGRPFACPETGLRHASYSPDGKRLSVTSYRPGRKGIFILDAETGQLEARVPDLLAGSVHLSPDGNHFVIGLNACRAEVWDRAGPVVQLTISGHDKDVVTVAYAADGRALLSASNDGTVRFSSLPDEAPLPPFALPFKQLKPAHLDPKKAYFTVDGVRCLATSPDGQLWFAGGWDQGGLLVNAADGSVRGEIPGQEAIITAAAFTPDNKRLLTGSANQEVCLWDVGTSCVLQGRWSCPNVISYLAISPDGSWAVVGTSTGHGCLLQLGSSEQSARRGLVDSVWRSGQSATFLPSGKGVLLGQVYGVDLWDLEKRQTTDTPFRHTSSVSAVAVDAAGQRAATGAWEVGQIWDLRSGNPIGPPLRHRARFRGLAFSPDGRLLASLASSGEARFWDTTTGRPIGPVLRLPGAGNALVFRPDGSEIWTATSAPLIYRWRAPRPVSDEANRLMLRAQILTGRELTPEGVVRMLDPETWRERRRQLEALAPGSVR